MTGIPSPRAYKLTQLYYADSLSITVKQEKSAEKGQFTL